jgi:2'-5' RNA ligase
VSGGLRCFVAVELPDGLRETIADHFAREGRAVAVVRWVPAANLHLTLKFLGDIEAQRLPTLQGALAQALAGAAPFTLALRGAGAFPTPERPRVIWVGAGKGAAEVSAMAAAVEGALAPLGFAPEARPFAPHLTVGRVKSPLHDRGALRRLLEAVREREWGEWLVSAAHLVRSELFPAGPIYSILHTASLPEETGAGQMKEP